MESHKTISSLLTAMHIGHFAKCADFHVLRFEDHVGDIPFQTKSRQCDFFQIFFSDQYNVDVVVDDVIFSTKNKTLLSFLAPLQTLSTDVKEEENIANGYMLVFQSSFLKNGESNFGVQSKFPYFNANYSPVYFLDKEQGDFAHIIEKIYRLFQVLTPENKAIIRSYLNILLYESRKAFFDGSISTSLSSRAHQIAFSFETLIRENSCKRKPLDFYARQLNISTVYLSECVKKATTKTAKQIIKEYTILEASTLLLQSENTIDFIADELGFSATSNFINFFKKATGLSPLKYRIENKTGFK